MEGNTSTWSEAIDFLVDPEGKGMSEAQAVAALKKAGYEPSDTKIPDDIITGLEAVYLGIEEAKEKIEKSASGKGGEMTVSSPEEIETFFIDAATNKLQTSGCAGLPLELIGFMAQNEIEGSEFIADLLHQIKMAKFEKRMQTNQRKFTKAVLGAQQENRRELNDIFDRGFVEAVTDEQDEESEVDLEGYRKANKEIAVQSQAKDSVHFDSVPTPKKKLTQAQLVAQVLANRSSQ
ncbi:MAG: hypothetical protein F6K55_03680 [Moorea sp. SIO4A3]|nr:hypothetical protein [Moorena sp. SIO4A3]